MEIKAQAKYIRMSPKKIRFYLKDVKKTTPAVALARLALSPDRAAKMLHGVLKSALANAKNNLQIEENEVQFSVLKVDEAPYLKRFRAGSKGMAKPYLRRSSHITIVLKHVPSGAAKAAKAGKQETNIKEIKSKVEKKEVIKKVKVIKKAKSSSVAKATTADKAK